MSTMIGEVASVAPAVRPPLSLRSNASWTLAGNVVYAACQWGMLVVLAKLGTEEMVGRFAFGLAVSAPILMFTNLELRSVQATDARHEYRFGDYLGLRLVTTSLALLAVLAVAACQHGAGGARLVVIVVGVAKCIESVSDGIYGLLQRLERMHLMAVSMMLKGVGSLAAMGLLVHLTHSITWGAVAMAAVWAGLLLLYDFPTASRALRPAGPAGGRLWHAAVRPAWRLSVLCRLAWLSLPLGAVVALISLVQNLPRYFIQHYWGEAALGVFAALAYVMVAGTTVIAALVNSAAPRLAHYHVTDLAAFRRLLLRLLAIALALGAGAVLIALGYGQRLLDLLYGPVYAQYWRAFAWTMAAAGLYYVAAVFRYSVTAARSFRVQALISFAAAAVTAVACVWLVPVHGVLGAAWALCLASAIQLIGYGTAAACAAADGGTGMEPGSRRRARARVRPVPFE
jgi:O-antigen/teichoic acid export membrane protein